MYFKMIKLMAKLQNIPDFANLYLEKYALALYLKMVEEG